MKSYNNIVFYNGHHNGDVHYSREFAKYIIRNTSVDNYYYIHRMSPRLLVDIPEITAHGLDVPVNITRKWTSLNQELLTQQIDDILFINLWVGRNYRTYLSNHGECTIEANYAGCKDTCETLGISKNIGPISNFIPSYNYEPFHTDDIDTFMDGNVDKIKVLISNGEFLSGQAKNFEMASIINKLCKEYPNVIFFASNGEDGIDTTLPNFYYTSDVIKLNCSDLVENSYLSTYCDLIVGRASGAYCFACTKENWESDKTVICFSKRESEGMWAENSTGIWSDTADTDEAFNIIIKELNKRIDSNE